MTDLMEQLRDLGDLNDSWSEEHVTHDPAPLYVIEGPAPERRRFPVIPAAVAAGLLVIAVSVAVIVNDDPSSEVITDPAAENSAEQPSDQEWHADWTADFPDRLAGDLPDGTAWTIEIAANSTEVCFQIGAAHGCGDPPQPFTVVGTPNGHQLAYGLVHLGLLDSASGERVTGPATSIELELVDGTTFTADHVGERLWATVVPAGAALRRSFTQKWDSGMAWRQSEPPTIAGEARDTTDELLAQREAERRRQEQLAAEREARRQQQEAEQGPAED